MTLKQLIYFKRLSDILNYTQTAKELFISQPSLSYTIKELETELGVSLFTKIENTNRIRLSAAGEIFLSHISAALKNVDEGCSAVRQYMAAEASTLRIGYIHTFPLNMIKNLLRDFQAFRSDPDAGADAGADGGVKDYTLYREISSSNSSLLNSITSNKLNFAFSLSMNDDVEGFPFFEQELFVVVSKNHPLGKRHTLTFDELRREPCIRVDHATEINSRLNDIFHRYSYEPVISFQADNMNAALAYVMDYNCYTIAPLISTADFSELNTLTIEGHPMARPIYFTWKKGKKFTPLEKRFYDYVRSRA